MPDLESKLKQKPGNPRRRLNVGFEQQDDVKIAQLAKKRGCSKAQVVREAALRYLAGVETR